MKSKIKDIILSIKNKKASQAQKFVQEILYDKINSTLTLRKQELQKNFLKDKEK